MQSIKKRDSQEFLISRRRYLYMPPVPRSCRCDRSAPSAPAPLASSSSSHGSGEIVSDRTTACRGSRPPPPSHFGLPLHDTVPPRRRRLERENGRPAVAAVRHWEYGEGARIGGGRVGVENSEGFPWHQSMTKREQESSTEEERAEHASSEGPVVLRSKLSTERQRRKSHKKNREKEKHSFFARACGT